jgi:flagellar protein FlaI
MFHSEGITEGERECPFTLEKVAGKRLMVVNCRNCLSNASLSNSQCREGLLKAFTHPQEADRLVMKKPFFKFYGADAIKGLEELAKAVKSVERIKLCESCRKKLGSPWGDPLHYYFRLKMGKCKECADAAAMAASELEKTELVKKAIELGDKDRAYSEIFRPELVPEMLSCHVDTKAPKEKAVETYKVDDVSVSMHSMPDRPDMLYFVSFPELNLTPDGVKTINRAFENLCEHKADIDFDPQSLRKEYGRIIREILDKTLEDKNVGKEEFDKMSAILNRHTIGYGIIEPLLADQRLQDVFIDSGSSLVHVVHSDYGECVTNISVTKEEIDKISTRLRAISGRPFDSSSPVLHTELEEFGVRVCGICQPSTYRGTGFAFRRRKSDPWTLSEFISVGMMDAYTAGLLSFLIDGQNSMLITGPRASGKTSLMTALMLEMQQNSRVILIEDTPEMPVDNMRRMGFKVEHLKTEAFAKGFELSTEDALRTSLRLGESILVIGEVRGKEARALFEAMRVGAAGNVVLGTVHGSGPYDTWDRVVNDLGVPSTSFKAVDMIVSTGAIRFGEDVKRHRRVLNVSEVGKDWKTEPKFSSMIDYKRSAGAWKASLSSSDTIRKVADVKGLTFKQAMENIAVRAKMKHDLAQLGKKRPELMGAEWTVKANNEFFRLASKSSDYKEVYKNWSKWLKESI